MRLALFDIDGTLTRGGGAGARALGRAFLDVHGWPDACRGLRFHGGTDRGLVRVVLERNGVASTDSAIEEVLARYVEILRSEVPRAPYAPLPGAAEILDALASEGVVVGLVTGNHPSGAEQKLRSAGLWRSFSVAAFGSESDDRADLVRLAVGRAGCAPERVFVIGDTEEDVRAARRAQALGVAVLTGGATRAAIEAESPHAIFSDLAEALAAGFWRI